MRHLLTRLMGEAPDPPPLDGEEAELAVAALLVRLARADDHYLDSERQRIDRVLARRRGLTLEEAARRRAIAEDIEAEAVDTVRFTRRIKERVALEDRAGILAALWEVAYADQDRGADEESMIRLVAGLLGIPDRDSALIRRRVLDDLGLREE